MPDHSSIDGNHWRLRVRFVLALLLTGMISGSLSALFLVSLDRVTKWHGRHPWLLLMLPLAGLIIASLYQRWGALAGRGGHLLVEEMREYKGIVPLRMAPMVLVTTLLTHLCGGSAGREGTAVQMGGAVSAWLARTFSLTPHRQRMLLMAGMAGGFGSVFGTPWAGGIFAVELPVRGRWQIGMLVPCWISAWVGHGICHAWGVAHTDYRVLGLTHEGLWGISWNTMAMAAFAALAFGLCGRCFVWLSHRTPSAFTRLCPQALWRPFFGGLLVIALVFALGSADYLGLGVTSQRAGGVSIMSCFTMGGADSWSWLWKMLFTIITLASGFKGGEVTPLFFIGAALGNAAAVITGQPVELFAGLGMIAVFAAAANTPLACAVLGMELFGPHYAILFAMVCLVSYGVGGRGGIYHAEK